MGGKDFMGSELIFSDTVHQFLQVLTLSPKNQNYIFLTFEFFPSGLAWNHPSLILGVHI